MQVGDLYNFVLLIVMVGIILGVGVIVLDNLQQTSGIGATAQTAVNDTINAITPIASTWLPLIVTVAVLAIVLFLVIRNYGQGAR
jgi:MFS superfamily sulfate permease-like transporter|tara:strand:- start:668 stop:922 length:255 start_codon:yes stop_codon:yes gene_type:complete